MSETSSELTVEYALDESEFVASLPLIIIFVGLLGHSRDDLARWQAEGVI